MTLGELIEMAAQYGFDTDSVNQQAVQLVPVRDQLH